MRQFALISLVAAWQCVALAPANRPLAAPGKHVHAQRAAVVRQQCMRVCVCVYGGCIYTFERATLHLRVSS